MKLFSFLLRYSRRQLLLALAAGVLSGLCNTGLLALINAALTRDSPRTVELAWMFGALCLMLGLTRTASELLLVHLGQDAILELRMNLSRQVLGVPLRDLEKLGFHSIMAVLADDIPTLALAINTIPVICINIAVVIACLVYLGWLSWSLFAIVLGLMIAGVVSYHLLVSRAFAALVRARQAGDELQKTFRAMTDGIKELKLHRAKRDGFLSEVLLSGAQSFRSHNTKGLSIYTAAATWGHVLVFIVIAMVLFVFPHIMNTAPRVLNGYAFVILYMTYPLQVILNTAPQLARANASLRRMSELGLSLSARLTESALPYDPQGHSSWRSIRLSRVTHSYEKEEEESRFIVGPLDLVLEPGELLFIIGGNGSGKTTFAKLLTGLYPPDAGDIYLDGERIDDQNRENYRQLFSVVFSDFHVSEKLLGMQQAKVDERANEYLAQLQLTHKVQVSDGKLSTTELSQGQRKRLALLIAYLEDRPVYLFDEWAADQDPAFKRIFYLQVLPELRSRGKAVVVITHDDRFFDVADRIVKFEDGKMLLYEKNAHVTAE